MQSLSGTVLLSVWTVKSSLTSSVRIRLCYAHKRKDLIETHLQPTILEQSDKWKRKIEKKYKRFLRHKERLPIARGIMRAKMQDAETFGGTPALSTRNTLHSHAHLCQGPTKPMRWPAWHPKYRFPAVYLLISREQPPVNQDRQLGHCSIS